MMSTPPRAARPPASLSAPPGRCVLPHRLPPRGWLPRLARGGAAVLVAIFVAACSTVPYSERTRVILTSEAEEMQLGEQAYGEILGQAPLSQDPYWTDIIDRSGRRIAAIADKSLQKDERPAFAWEFKLIDDPKTVNAFCLPGGKVAFYTGILPICRDEAGVAVVMGHEVAHALARHGGERISQQLVINLGVSILAAMSSKDPDTQAAVAGALGVGFGIAFVLPFSRDHESEADYIGLLMMAEAGYDPREAPRFWERMRQLKEQASGEEGGGGLDLEFLSTHPSDDARVSALEANMGEALDYYEKGTGVRLDPNRHIITSE